MSPRKGDKIVDTVSKVLPVWGNADMDFVILGCPHYPIDQVEYAACPVGEKGPGWDTVLGPCAAVHQGPGCALRLYGHHRTERRSGCRGAAKIDLGCVVPHCPGVTDLGQDPTEGIHTGDWGPGGRRQGHGGDSALEVRGGARRRRNVTRHPKRG